MDNYFSVPQPALGALISLLYSEPGVAPTQLTCLLVATKFSSNGLNKHKHYRDVTSVRHRRTHGHTYKHTNARLHRHPYTYKHSSI